MNNIKKYINKEDTVRILTWTDNEKFYIMVRQYNAHICATRIKGERVVNKWWDFYVKDFTDKNYANNYFNKIKKNNNISIITTVTDTDNKIVEDYMKKVEQYNAKRNKVNVISDEEANKEWEKAYKAINEWEDYIDHLKF